MLHWSTEEIVPFIGNKKIVVNFRECHPFIAENNKIVSHIDENLTGLVHEEVNTKITYHIYNLNAQLNILIRSFDTDIAAIMLGNA